jgi:signal peptidase I
MLPTLRLGEHVTVSLDPKYARRVEDIIIFHPPARADSATPVCGNPQQGPGYPQACGTPTPDKSTQLFIKRIVAAPGDELQMRHGRVMRSGEVQDEPYILACDSQRHARHVACTFRSPITIPPDHYFVLGDNRERSNDNRFWGPVPRAWIIGRVLP